MRDILRTAKSGAGITKIMFHAYVTHGQAKEYSQLLMDNEMLELDTKSLSIKQYRTTPKGMEYLAAIEKMSDLLPVATRHTATNNAFLF